MVVHCPSNGNFGRVNLIFDQEVKRGFLLARDVNTASTIPGLAERVARPNAAPGAPPTDRCSYLENSGFIVSFILHIILTIYFKPGFDTTPALSLSRSQVSLMNGSSTRFHCSLTPGGLGIIKLFQVVIGVYQCQQPVCCKKTSLSIVSHTVSVCYLVKQHKRLPSMEGTMLIEKGVDVNEPLEGNAKGAFSQRTLHIHCPGTWSLLT